MGTIQSFILKGIHIFKGISVYLLTNACSSALRALSFLFSHTLLHIFYLSPLSFPFSSIAPLPISTMSAGAYLSPLVCVLQLSTYTNLLVLMQTTLLLECLLPVEGAGGGRK